MANIKRIEKLNLHGLNFTTNKEEYQRSLNNRSETGSVLCEKILSKIDYDLIENAKLMLSGKKNIHFSKIKIVNESNYEIEWNVFNIKRFGEMLTVGCKTYSLATWRRWYDLNIIGSISKSWGGNEFWEDYGEFFMNFFKEQDI